MADWIATNGSGVGLLRRIYPATWRRAMAVGMTVEDVERCCEDATVATATRFDPAKGAFVTLLTWVIRQYVQKGIDERLGWRDASKHKPAAMGSLDKDVMGDGGTLYHALPAPAEADTGPDELYRYMESFVLQHYQPKEFKKRKRRKWSEEGDKGQQPGRG